MYANDQQIQSMTKQGLFNRTLAACYFPRISAALPVNAFWAALWKPRIGNGFLLFDWCWRRQAEFVEIAWTWIGASMIVVTSSTPQGGGRSFKNRKPIGEVGCCESRMAERIHWWTERWLELCFLEWLQWLQWSPHPQLLDVVWWSCSCSVV